MRSAAVDASRRRPGGGGDNLSASKLRAISEQDLTTLCRHDATFVPAIPLDEMAASGDFEPPAAARTAKKNKAAKKTAKKRATKRATAKKATAKKATAKKRATKTVTTKRKARAKRR